MKQIKKGSYARVEDLNSTIIVKVLKVLDDGFRADDKMFYFFSNVINTSKHIWKVLKIGDYVNGYRIIKINLKPPLKYVKCINDNCFKENEIKTIMTKEFFENNCYKLGD